ncbi:U3 small nucleolar ribonucleoprotein complex, subunit Mpp10 [Sparassis latifolia]
MPTIEGAGVLVELAKLSEEVDAKPEYFATGNDELCLTALSATKYIYDLALKSERKSRAHIVELLSSLVHSQAPRTRSQTGKQKGNQNPPQPVSKPPAWQDTPLTELYVDGMNEDQLWAQLELRSKNVCDMLEYTLDGDVESGDDVEGGELEGTKLRRVMMDEDIDMEDLEGMEGMEVDGDKADDDEDDESESGDEEESGEEEHQGQEDIAELRDPSDNDADLENPSFLSGGKRTLRRKHNFGSHPELDDGFFDLATFNAETEEAEARSVSRGKLGKEDSDEDNEDEDAEAVDLFAPIDDNAAAFDEEDLEGGPSESFYKDFFDPPPRAPKAKKPHATAEAIPTPSGKVRFHEQVRVKSIKAKGKGLPVSTMNLPLSMILNKNAENEYGETMSDESSEEDEDGAEDEDEDGAEDEDGEVDSEWDENGLNEDEDMGEAEEYGRETIERLKDDLFADEDQVQTGLSRHEKQMAALREEIATLESENVSKKDWMLMGEATSKSRPQNSLLEEDLEFERLMKSVPVITEEVVQSLEERIKARILESQFDDVVQRRPVEDKPFLPSRFFELQDTKSKQSLAEIYEDEYTATVSGGVAGEDRDGKLKKEHDEIEKLWETISGKLDALCNAHFTPKAPKASISTVANVAAATLESALPTTISTSTMLAPEEVFAPSARDLRARSELAPVEKRALRNKQKKAKKRTRDALEKTVDKFARTNRLGGIKRQKDAALKSVVKSGKGVTVVGKKNEDVVGKRKRTK